MISLKRCTMSSYFRRRYCWSQLPPELLDLVLQKLPHPDCLSFGKVCISWRSLFLDRRRLSRPPPCIMIIANLKPTMLIWGLCRDQLRVLPSLKPDLVPGAMVVGSCMGWLVVASLLWSPSSIHLVNPVTNERIQLPSVATGGVPMYPYRSGRRYPSGDIILIMRVHLSSPPNTGHCTLVARVLNQENKVYYLAQCKPFDSEWTIVTFQPHKLLQNGSDSVFHNGELYILRPNSDLLVCTFNPQPKMTTVPAICDIFWKRLVLSNGELLLIIRQGFSSGLPSIMHVFRYTKEMGGRWVRVESLGDRVLLIGKYGAESLCTKDLMGLTYEPNCIYYQFSIQFLEKYSMSDKRNHKIPTPHPPNSPAPHIQWIVSEAW